MEKVEKQVLATVLKRKKLVDDLIENLSLDCFTDKTCREAYKWIEGKYKQGESVSQTKLQVNTDIDVEELISEGMNEIEFKDQLEVLQNERTKRQVQRVLREGYKETERNDDINEALDNITEKIFDINYDPKHNDHIYYNNELLNEFFDQIAKIKNGEEIFKGIPTGFPKLDSVLGGLQRGHLTVIAASTSIGKTSLALKIGLNLVRQGNRVLINSLEMDHNEIMTKLVALDSNVPTSDYMRAITKPQEKNMNVTLNNLMDKDLIVSDKRGLTTNEIKARARRIIRKEGSLDLLIVDYLQMITMIDGDNREQKTGNAVLSLRNLASELDIPIVLLSQFNRSRKGKPKMEYMRDSGRIEEIADEILLPYRPEFEDKTDKYREEAKLIIDKGRTVGTGVIDMHFYPKIQLWQDEYEFMNDGEIEIIRGD